MNEYQKAIIGLGVRVTGRNHARRVNDVSQLKAARSSGDKRIYNMMVSRGLELYNRMLPTEI